MWGEKGSGIERDVGCMVGVVVVAGDSEFGFCVATDSEDLGIMRGMLIDDFEPFNVCVPCSSIVMTWVVSEKIYFAVDLAVHRLGISKRQRCASSSVEACSGAAR